MMHRSDIHRVHGSGPFMHEAKPKPRKSAWRYWPFLAALLTAIWLGLVADKAWNQVQFDLEIYSDGY